jgi:hypothetical protein
MSTKTRYVSISAGPMKPFHRPLEGYYFHWWLRDGQIEGRREMGSEHYGIHLYFDGWRP